jgi:hypothetical protein
MGRRIASPASHVEVPVRIFGTDQPPVSGFSEKVTTVNVSRNGAELAGVRPESCGLDEIDRPHLWQQSRALPREVDRRSGYTPNAGHVGLLSTSHLKNRCGTSRSPPTPRTTTWRRLVETAQASPASAARTRSRFTFDDGASFWGRVADLSLERLLRRDAHPLGAQAPS